MNTCGLCQYSEMRATGEGLCHCMDSDKYAEEVDYHDKKCDSFESLSELFVSELWDRR